MYWLISAYDVLGELHIRARCVDDQQGDGDPLEPVFQRSSTIPLPRGSSAYPDVLQEVATELNNMAYREL